MKRGILRVLHSSLIIGFLLGIHLLSPPAASTQTKAGELPSASLKPGDMVRITVWRKPELSGEFEIAMDGTIRHPLYRAVDVAGVPLATAESRLSEFLRQYELEPAFVIEPLLRIAIGGEVRQPNAYALPPEVTISQAVARAGGYTERGNPSQVRLIRDGQEIIIDLSRPYDGWGQLPIRSGDQIIVDRRASIFRDYVAPVASIAGAVAAIVNVYLRSR